MLGELNEQQIEGLLKQQVIGRLGCHNKGTVYVVPLHYFYKDSVIYCHSAAGKKIEMMRRNPQVCFQVDDIRSVFRWKSVIAWGLFEEITDPDEKQQAMQGITHRLMPLANNPSNHASHGIAENENDIGTTIDPVVFKVVLSRKTGRFEE
ncbi:pyridoxamine 5'-phosphate oxidase family protein [Mucilaginibacter aquariorum]|uniref:Pyridoxamine 5'-phosphate oxidase family protein n=1 Tax=Mucilaginibacter aquariorum TaxID=2967225 RepID=A0ABT1T3J5_9SPHI|nr:pyridoxamine 5'-phosphate oxidase family protein [Mucilaginibacter aquariorum]MCQ6959169.1 pyridoxamine 5'-phosphate oxidase family protein [Mucilaginibacter aquariorum]